MGLKENLTFIALIFAYLVWSVVFFIPSKVYIEYCCRRYKDCSRCPALNFCNEFVDYDPFDESTEDALRRR